MNRIWIQDSEDGHLSFDLKEVLAAVNQPALNIFWTASRVEAIRDEPIFVIGNSASAIEDLAQSGERVSSQHLMELARGIHQTIWGNLEATKVPLH